MTTMDRMLLTSISNLPPRNGDAFTIPDRGCTFDSLSLQVSEGRHPTSEFSTELKQPKISFRRNTHLMDLDSQSTAEAKGELPMELDNHVEATIEASVTNVPEIEETKNHEQLSENEQPSRKRHEDILSGPIETHASSPIELPSTNTTGVEVQEMSAQDLVQDNQVSLNVPADSEENGLPSIARNTANNTGDDSDDGIVVRPRSRSKRSAIDEDIEDAGTKSAKPEDNSLEAVEKVQMAMQPDLPVSNDDDDEEGNTKVDGNGALKGDRKYTSKAFQLPTRGETYYFLATEIARVSGYRDSYLLFNKNRNLRKLMTTEAEKAFLIQQELIPYSYRNRQIGVVNALSIYKTFGAKVIVKGLRVKDDYFAQRARDQGFTEDDFANEDDRPAGDRVNTQYDAQRRIETDVGMASANNAKSATDYNKMINEQRQARVEARLQNFHKIARKV